ncbi:MAG: outer membrane beta-barrel protein [Chitinophagaceae bacterium]|nr:outer membrane beta-barrel protein [Chitinophagaceae bacterium]
MYIRLLLLSVLSVALSTVATAQPYTIKGVVSDTVNMNNLNNASITLIHAEDSVLESFTRTKPDGSFSLAVGSKGKYILLSVFPGFADYVDKIEVKGDQILDLGEIPMVSRTHLMKEFVFTDQFAAIKIKGDTVEYVADSFKVKDNATVEELLKKLPGLQVDKDGNIQAHGQKVEKLLVDGEEFFTDDPAVVSKSLQAKAVDKVQVFDKKSEQAEFTGIDDGEVTRTVNLQLKDNMKKGYFGKVATGGGAGDDQNYFENQAMMNYFKGKKKVSAFGIVANTGKIGLGWEDRDKYGGGDDNTSFEDGVMYTTSSNDEFESWSGKYNGRGFPKAWTGGLHYSDKWNEDKHHLSGNYRYAKQNIESIDNTFAQVILPNSQQFSDQSEDEFKTGQRHKVDGLYEWKTDSLSTLKLTASVNYTNSRNESKFTQYNMNGDGDTTLDNTRLTNNDATTKRLLSSLTWKKKFNKKRRTFLVTMSERYEESESTGFLNSVNISALNGGVVETTDQKKQNTSGALTLGGNAVYTEPITKAMAVSVEYKLAVNNSSSERATYNKANPNADVYNELDSVYSNNYAYNIVTHTGGTNLNWDYKKVDFSTGLSAANTNFTQRDLRVDTAFSYGVVNLFPKAMLRYKISKQTSIRFNYYGNTRQPTIQQVQPLKDNTNPNNVAIGNSNLKQEFRNTFSLNANDYKVLSGRWIYLYSSFNLIDNSITRSESIDNLGRRTYQYINVDGNYSGYAGGGIGKRITKLNARIGGNFNTSINRTNNMVNGVKNVSNYNMYSVGLNGGYESKDEKIDIEFNTDYTYNDNKATISTQATSYWTIENTLNISVELPLKFEIGTDVNWYVRQRTVVFDRNNNVLHWNAYLSKKLQKNDQLELRASAYDILNQNKGFSRYASSNQITENNYNTIRRYGLISLIWNFTKMSAGATPENNAANFIVN